MDPSTMMMLAGGLGGLGGGGGKTSISTSSSQAFNGSFAINPTISIASGPGSYSYPSPTGNATGSAPSTASASGGWPNDYPVDPSMGGAMPVSDVNLGPQLGGDLFDAIPGGGMTALLVAGGLAWYLMKG